jgi:hypothetical protein
MNVDNVLWFYLPFYGLMGLRIILELGTREMGKLNKYSFVTTITNN